MSLRQEAWQSADSDENATDALLPILIYCSESKGTELDGAEFVDSASALLTESVHTLNDYWQARGRDKGRVGVAASGKIGRNQPCPCGSGRKYKKCCLN